ncbi:cytidine deaminase [Aeromicrobium alkaliterrae]|uniref:Cytidine deaminase n=1 Tax=Aeromicrobium alkaliterrae TaxID=302168 RepID=A0ABN2JGT5_9ACTN
MTIEVEAEDAKLVTLARASRARTSAVQGAAVRDQDGRTYTAATIRLESLELEALDLAVAMAVSSGATSLEAGAVVGPEDRLVNLDAFRELAGEGTPVFSAFPDGTVHAVKHS